MKSSFKDKFNYKLITNGKSIANKIDKRISSNIPYKIVYYFINNILKKDFKLTDNKFNGIKDLPSIEEIPYKFWVMWWQGLDNEQTPLIIKKNISRLISIIGSENLIVITKDNYQKYTNISSNIIKKLKNKQISYTTWSDILRFHLLRDNGGYWIDSTAVISPIFFKYLNSNRKEQFFTLCNTTPNYRNITKSQWMLWLMGGIPHYNLFEYMCLFFDIYFENHEKSIDYFLTDDVINHYSKIYPEFIKECQKYKKEWYRYYWLENLNEIYNPTYINKFKINIEYSVQKITYKVDSKIFRNSNNLWNTLISEKDGIDKL